MHHSGANSAQMQPPDMRNFQHVSSELQGPGPLTGNAAGNVVNLNSNVLPNSAPSTSNDQMPNYPVKENPATMKSSKSEHIPAIDNEHSNDLGNDILNRVSSILSDPSVLQNALSQLKSEKKSGSTILSDASKLPVKSCTESDQNSDNSLEESIFEQQTSMIQKIVEATLKAVVPVNTVSAPDSKAIPTPSTNTVR